MRTASVIAFNVVQKKMPFSDSVPRFRWIPHSMMLANKVIHANLVIVSCLGIGVIKQWYGIHACIKISSNWACVGYNSSAKNSIRRNICVRIQG